MSPLSYESCSLKILAVDDQDFVVQVIEAMLAQDGHRVATFTRGEDALAEFVAGSWNVVLTDREMPGMDGERLAEEIKQRSPSTPVIMVTGRPPSADYRGVDAIVEKPFTRDTLVRAITRCLAA